MYNTLKTYTELCLVFPDLVVQFGVVQSQTNVGSEELHRLPVLLREDLLPGVLLVLVDKLKDSQDCSSDSEGGAVQGPRPPAGLYFTIDKV